MTDPHYSDGDVTLWHGDALTVARTLETGTVRTIVTSPPYFGLRDYGTAGQLGAEATVGEYVANLVALFRELRRVLADDGTLWLNLGDSYARDPGKGGSGTPNGRNVAQMGYGGGNLGGLPEKNLLGVPWRVAFGLQDDGWILRSDIIWAKPNPMPESVTDRPTKAHEYLFLLAKQPRYYYDAGAIAEPVSAANIEHERRYSNRPRVSHRINPDRSDGGIGQTQTFSRPDPTVRNKRSVWEVQPSRFHEAHFAVYPEELVRPCILAGSRPGDTILDPFSGSGTTGMVANYEGRRYVGIDVNADYLDLSLRTRFAAPVLNLWNDEETA